MSDRPAESVARPWDDPKDPKPEIYGPDGVPTEEFMAWVHRSGHRRWVYMGFDKAEQSDGPPPCLRCGEPCHKVPVPAQPGDDAWVWGHDCSPAQTEGRNDA